MVRGFGGEAGFAVDITFGRCRGESSSREDVVKTPAEVSLHGVNDAIIPKRELPLFVIMFSEDINEAPFEDFPERGLLVGVETDGAREVLRVINVARLGGDVQVAGPTQEVLRGIFFFEEAAQAGEPFEFVLEAGRVDVGTLRHVGIND